MLRLGHTFIMFMVGTYFGSNFRVIWPSVLIIWRGVVKTRPLRKICLEKKKRSGEPRFNMGKHVPNMIDHSEVLTNHNPILQPYCSRLETQHAWGILCSMLDMLENFKVSLHYIIHIDLYSNIIHQIKSITHNMKLGTWSKGHQGLKQ